MKDKPCMDNNQIILVSETLTDFSLGMKLAFRHAPGDKAEYWWIYNPSDTKYKYCTKNPDMLGVSTNKFIVLSWAASDGETHKQRLPCKMDCDASTSFIWAWLQEQDYGGQPDHDGSNHKGFILFNEPWGHVGGDYYAIIAVGPAWAMAGK